MAATIEQIKQADEWDIRSLMNDTKYIVAGSARKILSVEELQDRFPNAQDRRMTSHALVGEIMESDDFIRVQMSICDMAGRVSSDMALIAVDGLDDTKEIDFSWYNPADGYDALRIIITIRRFLDYQAEVHHHNFTKPSKVELSDYEVLKALHNHLAPKAEQYLAYTPYCAAEDVEMSSLEDILRNGSVLTIGEQEEVKKTAPSIATYDTTTLSFNRLNDSASNWGG